MMVMLVRSCGEIVEQGLVESKGGNIHSLLVLGHKVLVMIVNSQHIWTGESEAKVSSMQQQQEQHHHRQHPQQQQL